MNYMFVVSALVLSFLAGCGKTIPSCGDQRVQAMLIKAVKESVTPDFLNSMKEEIPGAVNPPSGLTYWSIVSATSSANPAVGGISSTKIDRDVGRSYCDAVMSGHVSHEVKIKLSDLIASRLGEGVVELVMSSATAALEELVKLNDGKVKAEGTTITVTIKQPLPKVLNYSANLTDKGDQLVVAIQP